MNCRLKIEQIGFFSLQSCLVYSMLNLVNSEYSDPMTVTSVPLRILSSPLLEDLYLLSLSKFFNSSKDTGVFYVRASHCSIFLCAY